MSNNIINFLYILFSTNVAMRYLSIMAKIFHFGTTATERLTIFGQEIRQKNIFASAESTETAPSRNMAKSATAIPL